jgi:hypothetical protein
MPSKARRVVLRNLRGLLPSVLRRRGLGRRARANKGCGPFLTTAEAQSPPSYNAPYRLPALHGRSEACEDLFVMVIVGSTNRPAWPNYLSEKNRAGADDRARMRLKLIQEDAWNGP